MGNVIGLVIFLAIVAAIGYGIYKAVSKTVAHMKYRKGLSPEEKQHLVLVKAADKGIRRAEADYNGRVKRARKEVAKAAAPIKIQKLGAVQLTDEHLQTSNGQRPLTPDVQARVDTAGNLAAYAKSRSTLTRMGAGGLVLGPVGMLIGATAKKSKDIKVDKRELYLLVEAETWAETIEINPDKGKEARALAQAINLAARNVEQAKWKRSEAIRAANAHLAEVEQDRTAITEAQAHRAAIEAPAPRAALPA
jgi:hypothetical protein